MHVFMLFCSYVLAAPVDGVWVPLTKDGAVVDDVKGDAEHADLVDSLWWDVDEERFWIRTTLRDVSVSDEVAVVWFDAADVAHTGWRCTAGDCAVSTILDSAPLDLATWTPETGDVNVQALDDEGLDLAFGVLRSDLLDDYGVANADPFRLAVFTLHEGVLSDRAFCEGACEVLEMACDPVDLDRDQDGLTTAREIWLGANPDDVDTDGDGLADGAEPQTDDDLDGVYAVLDCDSDQDGLGDGLESGVEEPLSLKSKDQDCFVVDIDPATTTDPWVADSDGGGLQDGAEDWNGNGRWDAPWETSPLDPDDDVDTDLDGIPDVVEMAAPDKQIDDEDSDGDGIPDAVEGPTDTDQDGLPDFADTDADGDGLLDAEEGSGDTDGDGLPHFRDLDSDGDTWLDAEEGLADSDFDGIPDRLDLDSDNDGIPDEEESGDVDCDGLEDRVDSDHESDFCDTGQPTPGTLDEPWSGPSRPVGPDLTDTWFGGGGCATVSHGGHLFWLVLPFLLFRRAALVGWLAIAGVANAQEVNVDRFRPAAGSSWLMTEDPWISKHQHGVSTTTDVATDVVTLRGEGGVMESLVPQVVSTRVALHSAPVRGVGVGLVVPWHATNWGRSVGDVEFSTRATRALGQSFRAGLTFSGALGSGGQPWLSSALPTVQGGALVGWEAEPFRLVLSSGGRSGTGERVGRLSVGPSWTWSAAAAYTPDPRWRIGLEGYGEQQFKTEDIRGGGPAEWLFSTAFQLPWVSLRAGAGTGLGGGLGVPRWRAVLSLTVGPPMGEPT